MRDMKDKIKLFNEKKVRTHWDDKQEKWYFSVIDVIEILTGSSIPKRYWSDLKKKLEIEGSEVYDKIVRLKISGELEERDEQSTKCLQLILEPDFVQLSGN